MNRFTTICILLLSMFSLFSQNTKTVDKHEDENIIDTSKVIFFIEDKNATALETLYKTLVDTTIICVEGELMDYKNAIFRYGEKARNGIMIFKHLPNEEDKTTDN